MRNPSRRSLLALSAMLLIVALACSESTRPSPESRSLAGTWDLSTVLDSLTYTDSCSTPTSNGGAPDCHDTTVVNTVGTLGGIVVLGDTVRGTVPEFVMPVANAALRVGECGTSCSPSVAQFSVSPASVNRYGRDSLAFQATMTGPAWIDYNGWIAGDSISGRIMVQTFANCCEHRYYTGTFVMRQRPPEY
jgi:hypothetical protein